MEFVLSYLEVIEFLLEMIHVFSVVFIWAKISKDRVWKIMAIIQHYCLYIICKVMSQITLAFCLLNCSTRMNWYLALADLQTTTLYLKWKFLRHWVFWWHRGDSSFTVYSSFVKMCFTSLSKMGGHQPRYSINYQSISFQNVPYSINLPIFQKLAYLGHFFFLITLDNSTCKED